MNRAAAQVSSVLCCLGKLGLQAVSSSVNTNEVGLFPVGLYTHNKHLKSLLIHKYVLYIVTSPGCET